MDTHVMEHHTSTAIDPSLRISLEHHEETGMRIIVLPARPPSGLAPVPVHLVPVPPTVDPDDDLANATWEDAEWQ